MTIMVIQIRRLLQISNEILCEGSDSMQASTLNGGVCVLIRDIFERCYSFADIQLLLFQLPGVVYGIGRALTDRSNVGCNCRSSLWCL